MMIKYLIAAVVMLVLGAVLPSLTRGQENRTWFVFLLRKPVPMLCFGIAVGLLVIALVSLIKG